MSYIVPRDKPQGCSECPYSNLYDDCRLIRWSERIITVEEQYQHCPLIEVSTPHGDLVDRSELIAEYDRQHKGPAGGARRIMEQATTVIKAEV